MIKTTSLDQIEIISNGTVQVRIALRVEDGPNILAHKWHRTALPPETTIDLQMAAVNEHLVQMGYNPVSASDIAKIASICSAAWTTEIISAYRLINQQA